MSDLPVTCVVPFRRRGLWSRLVQIFSPDAEEEAIRRSRQKLAEYDDRLLRDIGMTREEALSRAPRSVSNALDPSVMMRAR